MKMFSMLDTAYDKAGERFDALITGLEKPCEARYVLSSGTSCSPADDDSLVLSDNLSYMAFLIHSGKAESFDFIYADPPYNTGSDQRVYKDRWAGGIPEYIEELTVRLMCMTKLLKSTGTLALHLDGHAVHYAKLVLDEMLGRENFVNELIWCYKSGGAGKKSFAKKHDNILIYSTSAEYYFNVQKEKSYNRGFKPYRFKGVEEYCDETGWYTLVNRKDVLSVNMVGRTSSERTGYPTQKPGELIDILLESLCPKGGLAADFYCGSGTLAARALGSERHFITCDSLPAAAETAEERLRALGWTGGFWKDAAPAQPE